MAEPVGRDQHFSAAASGEEVFIYGGELGYSWCDDPNSFHLFSVEREKWKDLKGTGQHPPKG